MPIFWQAVKYLERINLKFIAVTADEASQNRKFFKMHKYLCGVSDADVIYRTKNIHTKEMRFIYFFADAPHLVKTSRIVLIILDPNVRQDTCGFFLLWSHIGCLYYEDLESDLKLVNKLASGYINLSSYSVISVNLAAQVLSDAVGNALNSFGPEEAGKTVQFCIMMDKLFDCLNVRNTKEHIIKGKPFLKPHESVNDIRFA